MGISVSSMASSRGQAWVRFPCGHMKPGLACKNSPTLMSDTALLISSGDGGRSCGRRWPVGRLPCRSGRYRGAFSGEGGEGSP